MRSRYMILFSTIVLVAGFTAGYIYHKSDSPTMKHANSENPDELPFLSKRIFVENPNDTRINFSGLRSAYREYFTKNNLAGSLYFEYLPTGTSVRINPDARYRAASLIKLPVAMELYKAKELGKLSLNQEISLKQEWLNDGYGDLYKKGVGYTLTLDKAVTIMLQDSDNTALRAILDTTTPLLDNSNRALGALDIEATVANDGSIDIGTRSYSSFLKCLYFACYNSKDDSNQILTLLTETDFDNRLAAGVDNKDIKIAHKIGVFNTAVQSDCGIIYLEDRNYTLCVMLEGNDDDTTNNHIATLSKLAYQFVSAE